MKITLKPRYIKTNLLLNLLESSFAQMGGQLYKKWCHEDSTTHTLIHAIFI